MKRVTLLFLAWILPPMLLSATTDQKIPVITLNGHLAVSLFVGDVYSELGAKAIDQNDGEVSVDINGTVNTSKSGTYTITYSAVDQAGNRAEAKRIVVVVEPKLISLALETNATSINLGHKAQLTLTGTYENNSTKILSSFPRCTW